MKNNEKKKLPLALKIAAGASVALGAAALFAMQAFASLSSSESANDEPEQDDEFDDNPGYISRKKEYTGYVPAGCSACGGPYPMCKMGCPIFDDE